jgi:Domain of unknown function (DUF4159)
MRLRNVFLLVFTGLLTLWGVLRAQNPFREYPALEYVDFPLPPDWKQPAEFTRARLKYPDVMNFGMGRDVYWTMDYPRSDRHLLQGIRRLTRVDTRSVEQVIEFDQTDDAYNWPFLYAVEVGHWRLTDLQVRQFREFIDRGGFFMCDDFHGTQEWAVFTDSMNKVFPDHQIVELDNKDNVFHSVFDLNDRFQVPGWNAWIEGHQTYEKDGYEPRWRGIYDNKGRLVVVICHNMDLGDAWEHSDDPEYPEKFASLAYRIAMNYVIYDLSH